MEEQIYFLITEIKKGRRKKGNYNYIIYICSYNRENTNRKRNKSLLSFYTQTREKTIQKTEQKSKNKISNPGERTNYY